MLSHQYLDGVKAQRDRDIAKLRKKKRL